jgi:hypothetical protein
MESVTDIFPSALHNTIQHLPFLTKILSKFFLGSHSHYLMSLTYLCPLPLFSMWKNVKTKRAMYCDIMIEGFPLEYLTLDFKLCLSVTVKQ